MALTINYIKVVSIENFAQLEGIDLIVDERDVFKLSRFTAHGDGVEVKTGCILSGIYGQGNSPDEALADLADKWSKQLLVINAYKPNRREIVAPALRHF